MDSNPGASDEDVLQVDYTLQEQGQPLMAILEAITRLLGSGARELEPLEHAVNVEALTELLQHDRTDFYRGQGVTAPGELGVTFRYEGCLVAVTRDRIRVRPA